MLWQTLFEHSIPLTLDFLLHIRQGRSRPCPVVPLSFCESFGLLVLGLGFFGCAPGHPEAFGWMMLEMIRMADAYGVSKYRNAFLHFHCSLLWLKKEKPAAHRCLMENVCCLAGVFIEVPLPSPALS